MSKDNSKVCNPLKKNGTYSVQIKDLGPKGDGIAWLHGVKLIIPNTLPGEQVTFKLIKLNKSHGFGKCLSIEYSSKDRIVPPCPVASRCGGCQLQHQRYLAQIAFKEHMLKDSFEDQSLNSGKIQPTIPSPLHLYYRNKAQFVVKSDAKTGRPSIGLYARHSHRVIDIETCFIQHPLVNDVLAIVKEWLNITAISLYDEGSHHGILRYVVVRIGVTTNDVMVGLVATSMTDDYQELILKLQSIKTLKSVLLNINSEQTDTVLGSDNNVLWGDSYITDRIGERAFRFSLSSFFQSNPVQTKELYEVVQREAGLTLDDTVWDLYSGVGTIGLSLAKKVKKVICVEENEVAVCHARENITLNHVDNIMCLASDVQVYLAQQAPIPEDIVIIDPPRKGCSSVFLETICRLMPKVLVYVSCYPSSLARDLSVLTADCYSISKIQPVDMFPQTVHLETVVVLKRQDR